MEKPKNNPQPPKTDEERSTTIKPETPRQPKTDPKPNPNPKR